MITIETHEPADMNSRGSSDSSLFARGCLLAERPIAVPVDGWIQKRLAGKYLYYDPRIGLAQARSGDLSVTLLGHAIDIQHDTSKPEPVVRYLLNALAHSRTAFMEALSWLSGRYWVVDSGPEGTWVQTDAVALRSLYWSPEHRLVSSHQNLIAETAGGLEPSLFGRPEWRKGNRAFSYPGNECHWNGVKFLTANHELNLTSFKFRRVEMRPPELRSTQSVARRVLELTRTQLPHLLQYANPLVSLTAGQDSRTTLAILRPHANRFTYFTYALLYSRRRRAVEIDRRDSMALSEKMSLKRHKVLDIHGPLEDKQLGKIFQRNSPRASNRNVAARYRDEFSHSEIHVRSSFNEVGSAVYRAKYNPSQVDPKLLSDILTFETGYTAETLAATEEYVDSTNMLNISGYDPLDLYYWELRMGSWLGNISQESDIAFDTHILINSREIVRTLLSAPLSDRVLMNTYHELIHKSWPDLYSIPVNGKPQSFPGPQFP